MTKQLKTSICIVILPFIISASLHFLDDWLSYPICFVSGMLFLGAWYSLKDEKTLDNQNL